MRYIKGIVALLVLGLSLSASVSAQSLHFIGFANTLDRGIGGNCGDDLTHMHSTASYLADSFGYDFKLYQNIGEDCSKERLMELLSTLPCTPEDIVIFFYSGHGVHAKADAGNLPQMCLKYGGYQEKNFVPVRVVKEVLSQRGARLNLIVTDCCNNISSSVSAKGLFADKANTSLTLGSEDIKNLRKLFFDKKGTVVMTSSKKGQVSLCDRRGGSFFTNVFIEAIDRVKDGLVAADWNQFSNDVKKETLSRTAQVVRESPEPMEPQEPYSEFYFSTGSSNNPVAVSNANPAPSRFETTDRAGKFFANLLNSQNTLNDKMSIANSAKNSLFSRDAQVRIVGRDGSTSIGLEDIDTFLSRICMSKKIRSVHVVKQAVNQADKYTYLVVQEIYNE